MQAPVLEGEVFDHVARFTATMERPAFYALMLRITRELGLRPIELAQLERDHFRHGELRIRHGHTKGGRGRSLRCSAALLSELDAYMGERQDRVFLNRQGVPMDNRAITKCMARLYRRAGVQASAYSGRRSLLTRLNDEGVGILTIQAIAGHSSPLTTAVYCAVTPAMMERALYGGALRR